jgi:hypothetical protein
LAFTSVVRGDSGGAAAPENLEQPREFGGAEIEVEAWIKEILRRGFGCPPTLGHHRSGCGHELNEAARTDSRNRPWIPS